MTFVIPVKSEPAAPGLQPKRNGAPQQRPVVLCQGVVPHQKWQDGNQGLIFAPLQGGNNAFTMFYPEAIGCKRQIAL